jgi:glycerophosphoryl diester phosphodiesterase
MPLILAHRGGPTDALPENALQTLLHTAELIPCPILEFDVRMTRDSVLVIAHDDTLDGHADTTGLISQKTWSELRAVKLLTRDKKPTSFPIATFDDILSGCKGKGILAIDAKPGTDLDKVIAAVTAHGAMNQSFLICYSIKDALYVSQRYPRLMLAIGFNKSEDIPVIRQSGLPLDKLIALTPRTLQPKSYYDQIHQLGIVCSMGTYGEGNLDEQPITTAAPEYKKLIEGGVDIITTNRPEEVAGLFH